jgi:hypothetical protein
MPLKSTKDWHDGRLAVMMRGKYLSRIGNARHFARPKEQAMQEEMAWKSHGYGPAAAKIGYRSRGDGGGKRYPFVFGAGNSSPREWEGR